MKLGLGSLEPRAKAVFLKRMVRRINETHGKPSCHRELNYTSYPIDLRGKRRLKEGQRIVKHGCRHCPRIIIVLSPTL
ncbi:hypothetical protein [Paraburkholderia haematera]|uniref:Uncharacterized protein n=1 Tax=Paraburkholderia haematera TaxID=2793077 RepID=A0ABN7L9N8_9BURK|nr:hypothetical protein [Paraburkholderia haematera]CAE6732838.1 hypothetical protein R69888_02146 [Paraburkholderia haematera]